MGLPFRRFLTSALVFVVVVWLVEGSAPPGGHPPRPGARGKASQNRLSGEKSPYLRQHAENPVHWYPWGEEAFEKARREGKPIFLSIGYSTCHWCHVMERESFSDDSVAALLNRYFVSIKVDREERPDVDQVYMTALQAMGMGGGWPLNVFLTPERAPFFGGTYFPPRSAFGHVGLMELLPKVYEAWTANRGEIESATRRLVTAMQAGPGRPAGADSGAVDPAGLRRQAFRALAAAEDSVNGGFGSAPKFPSPSNLSFLLRYWAEDPVAHAAALGIVTRQLDAMRAGGMHDHLGGGFHRYSTDGRWRVPHFEKMLYDQAQLARVYLEAYQVTGREEYARTARDILDYVARDLGTPEGAFASAEDADSEGKEGTFYLWSPEEVASVLGDGEAPLFVDRYGVGEPGSPEGGGAVLREAVPLAQAAARHGITAGEAERRLAESRRKLLAARDRRPRPHRDGKIVVSWNGLAISAFAYAQRVLGEDSYGQHAVRAAEFLWRRLRDPRTGALRRHWLGGPSGAPAQLDDYANLARGLTDLYGATRDPIWLDRAAALTEHARARFQDERDGLFFEAPGGDPYLPFRPKSDYDGAEPSGASALVASLAELGGLSDRPPWREEALAAARAYGAQLRGRAVSMPQMLNAMDLAWSPPRHVVIAGAGDAPDTRALIAEFNRRFLPRVVLIVNDGTGDRRALARAAPFASDLRPLGGKATAYVCVEYACRLPTSDPRILGAQLDAR